MDWLDLLAVQGTLKSLQEQVNSDGQIERKKKEYIELVECKEKDLAKYSSQEAALAFRVSE